MYKLGPVVLSLRGRREREREKGRISFREDDEGKVEDDDAVDPRGTTAQITG